VRGRAEPIAGSTRRDGGRRTTDADAVSPLAIFMERGRG
jgi:hypothetical protein